MEGGLRVAWPAFTFKCRRSGGKDKVEYRILTVEKREVGTGACWKWCNAPKIVHNASASHAEKSKLELDDGNRHHAVIRALVAIAAMTAHPAFSRRPYRPPRLTNMDMSLG